MKAAVLLLTLCLFFILSGCEDSKSKKRIADLEYQLASSESQIESIQSEFDDVKNAFDEVKSALDLLEGEVADFAFENWRINVPDVEDATSELESSINNLEIALSSMDSEF